VELSGLLAVCCQTISYVRPCSWSAHLLGAQGRVGTVEGALDSPWVLVERFAERFRHLSVGCICAQFAVLHLEPRQNALRKNAQAAAPICKYTELKLNVPCSAVLRGHGG
jgi:hypothetical protein